MVNKCSIHGKDIFFFLVERVFLLVHTGFMEFHYANDNRGLFWYIWGFFGTFGGLFWYFLGFLGD